jgi:hypothetical protein
VTERLATPTAHLTSEQSRRAECLRLAFELTTVATLDDRMQVARWLYDGRCPE